MLVNNHPVCLIGNIAAYCISNVDIPAVELIALTDRLGDSGSSRAVGNILEHLILKNGLSINAVCVSDGVLVDFPVSREGNALGDRSSKIECHAAEEPAAEGVACLCGIGGLCRKRAELNGLGCNALNIEAYCVAIDVPLGINRGVTLDGLCKVKCGLEALVRKPTAEGMSNLGGICRLCSRGVPANRLSVGLRANEADCVAVEIPLRIDSGL